MRILGYHLEAGSPEETVSRYFLKLHSKFFCAECLTAESGKKRKFNCKMCAFLSALLGTYWIIG